MSKSKRYTKTEALAYMKKKGIEITPSLLGKFKPMPIFSWLLAAMGACNSGINRYSKYSSLREAWKNATGHDLEWLCDELRIGCGASYKQCGEMLYTKKADKIWDAYVYAGEDPNVLRSATPCPTLKDMVEATKRIIKENA